MKKSLLKKIIAIALVVMTVLPMTACGKKKGKIYDNENDPLVFSTLEVDGVFNPFFSTSGTDSSVVGMTQLSMLANDEEGKPVYGDKYDTIVKDMQITNNGEPKDNGLKTTYMFVLKNNVRFSNGSYLTIKDVLFNFYVYLDPAYTGSSTIYSTDIVGLKAYRTQEADENEQDSVMEKFQIQASSRIQALAEACDTLWNDFFDEIETADDLKNKLQTEYVDKATGDSLDKYLVQDYVKALEFFRDELNDDWSNSLNSYQDQLFRDKDGNIHRNLFTTDVEMFLYNEGLISWDEKDAKLTGPTSPDYDAVKKWDKDMAINYVYNSNIPSNVSEIVSYWVTSTTLYDYITNAVMQDYFSGSGSERLYKNISGIQFANMTEAVTVNGVTYGAMFNADGSKNSNCYDGIGTDGEHVKDGSYEVLSITINNIDPKAIWNFAIGVAPMYYYSDEAHIEAFDYTENFGVEYASQDFLTNVVKDPDKVGVPVGAGPYMASTSNGGVARSSSDFHSNNIIYYERNPYYIMGAPLIKKERYQVVSTNNMTNMLYTGQIDWAEPSAKPEIIRELNNKKKDGIGNKSVQTSGYGYIGINAGKVPDLKVRQAIMHSINTQLAVDYYGTTASAIHRSMSLSSWAYPKGTTSYYPYIGGTIPSDLTVVNPDYRAYINYLKGKNAIASDNKLTAEQQSEFIQGLIGNGIKGTTITGAGYSGSNGAWTKGTNKLVYTFTIAGEETDHPAYNAMLGAANFLNRNGFQISVKTDANALKKLSSGALTVWAAAWGSTIDPDMYQVYHKDSKATSVLNWGYKQILMNNGGKYDTEKAIVEELSDLIDEARETDVQAERAAKYSQALDLVMQLAVELPTYQRDDLFAYNADKIDESTFFANPTAFKGLTSDIYKLSLVIK